MQQYNKRVNQLKSGATRAWKSSPTLLSTFRKGDTQGPRTRKIIIEASDKLYFREPKRTTCARMRLS
eukprot:4438336-Amphidinium_carterae.1